MMEKIPIQELEEQIKILQRDYNYNLKEYTVEIAIAKFKDKNYDFTNPNNTSSVIFHSAISKRLCLDFRSKV